MPNFLDYAALLICKYRNKEKAPTVGKECEVVNECMDKKTLPITCIGVQHSHLRVMVTRWL